MLLLLLLLLYNYYHCYYCYYYYYYNYYCFIVISLLFLLLLFVLLLFLFNKKLSGYYIVLLIVFVTLCWKHIKWLVHYDANNGKSTVNNRNVNNKTSSYSAPTSCLTNANSVKTSTGYRKFLKKKTRFSPIWFSCRCLAARTVIFGSKKHEYIPLKQCRVIIYVAGGCCFSSAACRYRFTLQVWHI